MPNGQARFSSQSVNYLSRFISRTVIGNHQLKIVVCLRSKSTNGFFQPGRLIVRADDDGNAHGKKSRSLAAGNGLNPSEN
jgi:hypothetical protein